MMIFSVIMEHKSRCLGSSSLWLFGKVTSNICCRVSTVIWLLMCSIPAVL